MTDNIVKFKCPHCQRQLAVKRPEKATAVSLTCINCKKQINIKIQEKPIRLAGTDTMASKIASLAVVEGPQREKTMYRLKKGVNIIGRSDPDTEQDVAIVGDPTISRRSVSIAVEEDMNGEVSYLLKVLNAANPVSVNSMRLHVGNSVRLKEGDTIVMGRTKLKLTL